MGIREMTWDINCLRDYAVRIETKNNDNSDVGSGFLFVPQKSKFIYIFTALHVVIRCFYRTEAKLCFDWKEQHFECGKTELEYCTLYQELSREALSRCPDERVREIVDNMIIKLELERQDGNKDIAVLRIPGNKLAQYSEFGKFVNCIDENKEVYDLPFCGLGYPNRKTVAIKLEGTCLQWDAKAELLTCQAQGMESNFVEAMHGFSGTGIVVDCGGRLVLAGLVTSCSREEMHQCFEVVGVSQILDQMKAMGWEVPNKMGQGKPPEDFLDRVEMFEKDLQLMEPDVKEGLRNILHGIDRSGTPEERAASEKFYDIPRCETERIACPVYWKGRYWTICICKILNNSETDNHYQGRDGKSLEIKYICTEGNGEADIATVVASAIMQNVLGDQIKGDSILVWQSAKSPDRNIFSKEKLKRIVGDIASGNMHKVSERPNKTGYDLMNGEMKEKDYGILHINYLLSKLEDCMSMDQVKEKIREGLEDVWR